MQNYDAQDIIGKAIQTVAEMSPQQTDGKWLERLTVETARHIKEWDIASCYPWAEWPERERRFPNTTNQDPGIDAVAVRGSDGQHIAIQCKSRQLNSLGQGNPITKEEVGDFALASANPFWAERWIVTNGDNPMTGQTMQALSMSDSPIKMVNIGNDLLQQQATFTLEEQPRSQPDPDVELLRQTKSSMQDEAVAESVRILREHEGCYSGGLPPGQARGKIILPCGTGKTRISLRIVEELTPPGELSIVLCPSIALVAQIRREYLQHTTAGVRALAVCSDETAGYDPKKEGSRNTAEDPTADASNVSASEVKGKVTTNPAEIAEWIEQGQGEERINVIFGTYQSSHRVAEALRTTGTKAAVLVADEAHRTAGLRRNRDKGKEQQVRDFTLCHDNAAFPAIYRVYQTATPRVYNVRKVATEKPGDWIVRSMDDETVFGVELYRKSYVEAVNNGWLADYRIIALGVNDPDAYAEANRLASRNSGKGRNALTSTDYLRGLAFALTMGGATQDKGNGDVLVKSCIAFMNTVKKSEDMAKDLQTDAVKQWVQKWLEDNGKNRQAADYTLEHLDATSNVTAREDAKRKLADSTEDKPYAITNVGIFGEGTDSPSLNAVAFLEPRKSPIDVIQAVGRAMRTAPGKELGYIICPILIPPNADPEQWLSASSMEEGWQELGQILLALRAHDSRIEDNLADLLYLYIPAEEPEIQRTIVAVAVSEGENRRIRYGEHEGPPGEAQKAVERVLEGKSRPTEEFSRIGAREEYGLPSEESRNVGDVRLAASYTESAGQAKPGEVALLDTPKPDTPTQDKPAPVEPTLILTGKNNGDGSTELRMDTVVRAKPKAGEPRGEVDLDKSKAKAKDMINKGDGIRLEHSSKKPRQRRTREEIAEQSAMMMLRLSGMEEHGNAIAMNLLSKSGLSDNRVIRDLNILETGIKEAAFHLSNDGLSSALDRHFGLDNLEPDKRKSQADGCTIAALLLMNASMLHQRISNGRWITGVSDLESIKNDVNVVRRIIREWNKIMLQDFHPVLIPAVRAIEATEDTGKLGGLERALRHITTEAERIAETYADMGADHAGPLFNRVMGNQASDGAYFTRPVAASIAARLTLDACSDVDWSDHKVWKAHKTVDLACGSGTLLAAVLTDMKRRAREQGTDYGQLADLQKLAVEEVIKGLDINPVSLQLAASQLIVGNTEVRYDHMGLHLMPYGPQEGGRVKAGTLELLEQKAIVARENELALPDDQIASQPVWAPAADAEIEKAVEAVKDARIIIMNPPFTSRRKMGEKFPKETQQALRKRVDTLEQVLVNADPSLTEFSDKNSVRPLFVALADAIEKRHDSVVTMIEPTIALSATSGLNERRVLAERFHIHTVLTCHQPGNINLSQNTNINESMVIMRRHTDSPKPPTRFINLDKMPTDENEVADLHQSLLDSQEGSIPNGWGEVSDWPAERMAEGDWTPAIWRSSKLAEAAWKFAASKDMRTIREHGYSCEATLQMMDKKNFVPAQPGVPGTFPIIDSKGADGQQSIRSTPDAEWQPTNPDEEQRLLNGGTYPQVGKLLEKAGYLLITSGQDTSTARLSAIADDNKYVGRGWLPVTGPGSQEAEAIAVFLNSTAGRLQLLRNAGRKLAFPQYNPEPLEGIRIPNVKDDRIRGILVGCWEGTRDMTVPQFRDGECEVRRLWDEAVADAMGWDAAELERLRLLLHQEPHVRGVGYGQYGDEAEE